MTGICGQRGFKFSVFNFQIAINHPDGFEEVNVSHLCLCIYRISLSLYLPMTIKSLSASAQYCCRRFVPVENINTVFLQTTLSKYEMQVVFQEMIIVLLEGNSMLSTF